jgi:hypothetical protein
MRRLLAPTLLSTPPSRAAARGSWAKAEGCFDNPAHQDPVDLPIRGVDDKRYPPMRSPVEAGPGRRSPLAALREARGDLCVAVAAVVLDRIGEGTLPERVADLAATLPAPVMDALPPPARLPVASAAGTGATPT